ncbi:hypothetical protein [Schlesneria paludicola]|uniref:hypothetical protein n=1 Tax=Schlesneria paludicola TaxID=360056 RepID=UPI00029A6112|nr:hypothetical protein [Schlesneria paludicola]
MKTDIRDSESIRTLRPLEVVAYLRARGWTSQRTKSDAISVWTADLNGDVYEAVVPTDNAIGDYALRMSEVLQALSSFEKRSQSQIFADLLTTFADVIRIRIDDPDMSDGTLPIEAHAQVAQKAKDLVMAAACAATEKKSVWHSRKPAPATEYIQNLRSGQTERGSYIITIISRVPPALDAPSNGELFEREIPFERRVIQTLASSLVYLDKAAARAASTGQFSEFESAVEMGVSANLCDAVAGLWGTDNSQRNLEFTFSWSPVRPVEGATPSWVKFAADRIPIIREAGRLMRERAPITDFEIIGPVIKLNRKAGENDGRITVFGQIDGTPKSVTMELIESEYELAIEYHRNGVIVRAVGTLVREGRSYVLKDAKCSPLTADFTS